METTKGKTKLHSGWWLLGTLPVFVWALGSGSSGIGLREMINALPAETAAQQDVLRVVFQLRLPLLIQAFICGGGLALGGTVLQALLQNPLAEPYVLGVSSGSAFGLVAGAALGFAGGYWGRIIFSTAGGGLVTLLLFAGALRGRNGMSTVQLILAGVILNALFSAVTMLIQSVFSPVQFKSSIALLMGRFTVVPWSAVLWSGGAVAVVALFLWIRYSPELDLLSLGRQEARGMGVAVDRVTVVTVGGVAFITAVSVALCGVIGFVGLVAPHAVRFLLGPRIGRLLPAVFLCGGAFMVAADTVSRTLIPATQLPVGAVTALLGAPLFLMILWRYGGGKRD